MRLTAREPAGRVVRRLARAGEHALREAALNAAHKQFPKQGLQTRVTRVYSFLPSFQRAKITHVEKA